MKNLSIRIVLVLCLGLLFSMTTVDAKPLEPAKEKAAISKKEWRQEKQLNRLEQKLGKAKTEKSKVRLEYKIQKLKNKKGVKSARNIMGWLVFISWIFCLMMVAILGNALFLTGVVFCALLGLFVL